LSYAVNCGCRDVDVSNEDPKNPYPADWRPNGVFFDYWDWRGNPNNHVPVVKMDSSFIMKGDGLDNTLMVSESLNAGKYFERNETNNGFIFDWPQPPGVKMINNSLDPATGLPAPTFQYPNGDGTSTQYFGPSSNHAGGVNVAFCSG